MKQYEAVIQTLEKLGGQATLAELYAQVMKISDCRWETKTPFASIRRIVQTRPEIFKVRPGLWALQSYKARLGLDEEANHSVEGAKQTHAYYQGLIASIGNLRGSKTFIPNQDKNKLFVNKPLSQLRSLQEIPQFSYGFLVKRSSTVDVIWFNEHLMPHSLFEVEHGTDMQNSLGKFCDLQDFNTQMIIAADEHRHREFDYKRQFKAFNDIKDRVKFWGYNTIVKQYEYESFKAQQSFLV